MAMRAARVVIVREAHVVVPTTPAMPIPPARTTKLPVSTEMSIRVGEHLVATSAHPDQSVVIDLRAWPLAGRAVPGFFAASVAPRAGGTALAVARHGHANPYRLYAFDPESRAVAPLRCESPWPDLRSVFDFGGRVLLVPGGSLDVDGRRPAWWRDGALTPLDLPAPPEPEVVEHDGKRYARSRRQDAFDAAPLPGAEALVVWFERLYRATDGGVAPLAADGLVAAWEPLREGRCHGQDDAGRALMLVNRRLVAVDRDGGWVDAAPGAEALTAMAPGPDGSWLLVGDETLTLLLPTERSVIEVDLRAMRVAPRMGLFMPRALWVPSRGAVLVTHAHDAWEFDLATLLREKRISMDKHAAKRVAARRAAWKRALRSGGSPVALDALSPLTRGGAVVTHPTLGDGAVTHATETLHRGVRCVTATVLFEEGPRQFDCLGARWVERVRGVNA